MKQHKFDGWVARDKGFGKLDYSFIYFEKPKAYAYNGKMDYDATTNIPKNFIPKGTCKKVKIIIEVSD